MKSIITNACFSLLIAVLVIGLIAGGVNSVFSANAEGTLSAKPSPLTGFAADAATPLAGDRPEDNKDDGASGNTDYVIEGETVPSDSPFMNIFEVILPTPPVDVITPPVKPEPQPQPQPDAPSDPDVDEDTDINENPGNTENGNNGTGVVPPSIDGSQLINTILNQNYGSGIQIFQSGKGDIPTDTSALYNAIHSGSNVASFIAVRLSDGAIISYDVNRLYRCASSYKALTSLYVYKQAAAGAYNLNTGLTYTSADYYSGSGIIKSSAFGTVYTLKQVADYSIRYSDNAAFVMLQRYINRGSLVDFATKLGCPNAAGFEYTWPNVSALDAAVWWAEIYDFAGKSSYGQDLYNVFLNATNPSIKKALNGEYAVAHKSGSMSYYFHDAGIVHSEDPYLLVVLTHNPYNASSNNQTYFASVVQQIHKLINP